MNNKLRNCNNVYRTKNYSIMLIHFNSDNCLQIQSKYKILKLNLMFIYIIQLISNIP